jgi:serine/threonine protein kinase
MGLPVQPDLIPRRTPRLNVPAELLRLGYVLLSRIGEGATAEVWDAKHGPTGRVVALKVSRGDIPEAAAISARMQTAWNVGRGLRHAHIVATLDGGVLPDGRAWLAMERLVGQDLQGELDARGVLEPARAVHITRQVAAGLQVLHRRGVVHRDVKPENVFLCASGHFADHVKLIDLGVLSVAVDDPERAHEDTGQLIMGTPLYLAPEMAEGHRPDGRADLYALGAMLYHLLCGQPPFEDEDPTEVVRRHMREPVPPLESRHSELPPALYALVAACLEKDPARRPADAQAVIDALAEVSDALAAGGEAEESLRQAAVPPIPGTGLPADWRYLHTVLGRYVGLIWRDRPLPQGLRDALEWAEDARLSVDTAHGALEVRRERADGLARVRIVAQGRLDAQRRDLVRALESGEAALRAAQREIEEAQVELSLIDDRYRTLISGLGGREVRGFDGFDVERVSALRRPVRGLLAARNEADLRLARARALERDAVEQLALLHAEALEVESAHHELRLREQDEERRAELMADAAADAAVTAQRAYENACLQLFTEYVEQAAARLRGTLPGV